LEPFPVDESKEFILWKVPFSQQEHEEIDGSVESPASLELDQQQEGGVDHVNAVRESIDAVRESVRGREADPFPRWHVATLGLRCSPERQKRGRRFTDSIQGKCRCGRVQLAVSGEVAHSRRISRHFSRREDVEWGA
jgi:hypothetical protein